MCRAGGVAGAGGGGSVLLLMLLASARADRYADYGGVKLPHYEYEAVVAGDAEGTGEESRAHEDYRDRDPLDYSKFEERRQAAGAGAAVKREADDADVWPPANSARRDERPRNSRRSRSDESHRWEPSDNEPQALDDAPAYKVVDDAFSNEEIPKFKSKSKRRRSKERRDISEDLTRALEGGRRGGRGRRGGERSDELELPPSGEEQYPHGLDEPLDGLAASPPAARALPAIRASPAIRAPPASKMTPNTQDPSDDYGSYDAMKPVFKLKDKLPSLLRRTTPSRAFAAPTLARREPPRGWPAAGGRRFDEPKRAPKRAKTRSTTTEPATTTPTTTTSKPTTTTTTATTVTQMTVTVNNMSDLLDPHRKLSLAEKSRLSILKKAMMKDSSKESETSKPAVLMQVTGGVQTVVMMEPRGTLPPFSEENRRYLLAMDETPQRLVQVKRLLRQKLLGRAKSISDLTDNWDELVCDYIDTSTLISHAASATPAATIFALAVACPWMVLRASS